MAGRKKINPVVKEDLTTKKTNIEEVTGHKSRIKFITDVFGSHGKHIKNNVEEVTEKEADYFVKIGVAIKC